MPQEEPPIKPCECEGCHREFSSRNAVFKHLTDTDGTCLPAAQYRDFVRYVLNHQKRDKVLVLYGYIPSTEYPSPDEPSSSSSSSLLKNGDDAARLLLDVLSASGGGVQETDDTGSTYTADADASSSPNNEPRQQSSQPINRSYGNSSRSTPIVAQEEGTAAVMEVLTARLPLQLPTPKKTSDEDWLNDINAKLREKLRGAGSDVDANAKAPQLRVFGRKVLPSSAARFNAETDVSHRRIEYLLPFDFLYCVGDDNNSNDNNSYDDPLPTTTMNCKNIGEFFSKFPSFTDGCFSRQEHNSKKTYYSKKNEELPATQRPEKETLLYLYSLKKIMQMITSQVVEGTVDGDNGNGNTTNSDGLGKESSPEHKQRRRGRGGNKQQDNSNIIEHSTTDGAEGSELPCTNGDQNRSSEGTTDGEEPQTTTNNNKKKADKKKQKKQQTSKKEKKKKTTNTTSILRRRRYHNFSPTVMVHEYLALRRMERFYHRATFRFDGVDDNRVTLSKQDGIGDQDLTNRPFVALSFTGDLFLTGQVLRAVGLFVALARGVIDRDFVACVFDDAYPHLVPLPPAPTFAMYAVEVNYVKWEGKLQSILTPRPSQHFPDGWNDAPTLDKIDEWQTTVREHTVQSWLKTGCDSDGRLVAERTWTTEVLEPWAERAREQLADYRLWKATVKKGNGGAASTEEGTAATAANGVPPPTLQLPPLKSVDPTIPSTFEKVLSCLREIDASGTWPSTSPKRQMVMVSTPNEQHESIGNGDPSTGTALELSVSVENARAKYNKESRSSAYVFAEGQGGASGSFSVGAMPGEQCIQPKANSLFPQLMKAAFELEIALFPDREPSSTIAVNRNGQFRPHIDSGAGAGQSTSAIVGLGTYSGGELVVEGEQVDIRYKAVEFNGWKQRHWTMPFSGERYSLVWFTPKGCEGVRGVDLCK